jgi:hypothetical protein
MSENACTTGWWAALVAPATAHQMAEKYATLSRLVSDVDRACRDRGLRRAARRWPGSLRECQRVRPEIYAERLRASRLGAAAPASRRCVWHARGHAAIPLWAELHALLGDQLAWRAARGALRRGRKDANVRDFVAWLGPARERWPDARELERMAGGRLSPRHAHAWLAARAGLSLEQLRGLLLDPSSESPLHDPP